MKTRWCGIFVLFVAASWLPDRSWGAIVEQYRVYSTSVVNAYDEHGHAAPHGLWTSGDRFGPEGTKSGGNYFDIQPHKSLFTQFDDFTATLVAEAINPYGEVAKIDLLFADFHDDLGSSVPGPPNPSNYKKEGGSNYNPAVQDFYGSVTGTIDIGGLVTKFDHFVAPHELQFGLGANAKDASEFGASAWIQDAADSPYAMSSHHWDLNLRLEAMPEPSSMIVWSTLGLITVATRRPRRRSEASRQVA